MRNDSYPAISRECLTRRKGHDPVEQLPLLQEEGSLSLLRSDEVLLHDMGRPLLETIVKYVNRRDTADWKIDQALKRSPDMITERRNVGHPSAIARIHLLNGDVFMMLVNNLKEKRLHIKIYDPATCQHLPFSGQVLRQNDLQELDLSLRRLRQTVHENSGAWSRTLELDTTHLMQETHVYAELPE